MKVNSFDPIANKNCTKLILGTLPSVISIDRNEYYANSHNVFWRIIKELFSLKDETSYQQCQTALKKNKIALWDVYASGARTGSADSTIKESKYNDFKEFFINHKKITTVYCNGRTAEKAARSNPCLAQKEIIYLPSTSPAYAKSFDWKLKHWEKLLD